MKPWRQKQLGVSTTNRHYRRGTKQPDVGFRDEGPIRPVLNGRTMMAGAHSRALRPAHTLRPGA